jgi:tRNA dimethylallyltransferase
MNKQIEFPVLALLGPTASGKSDLAVKIAEHFGCEIINCDSRQIYREMNIGTAKPSKSKQEILPHHLFDIVYPNETFSAGDYQARAVETIAKIKSKNKTPLITGGTGFYYMAVCEGLPETGSDPVIREHLKQKLKNEGLKALTEKLQSLDPEAFAKIDLQNSARVLRALEVILISGKPFSSNLPLKPLPGACFLPISVTRPRGVLHERIETRVEKMINAGLEQEVRSLYNRYSENAPGLRSIGYAEWRDYLYNNESLKSVKEKIVINSRQYAKRQETWFRKNPGTEFYNLQNPGEIDKIFMLCDNFLKKFA